MTQLCSTLLSHGSTATCPKGEVHIKSTSWLRKSKSSKLLNKLKISLAFKFPPKVYTTCNDSPISQQLLSYQCFLIKSKSPSKSRASKIHRCVNFELKTCFGCTWQWKSHWDMMKHVESKFVDWIRNTFRSPGEIKSEMDQHTGFYNLTMTYRLDSDIGWFYGTTDDLASHHTVAPGMNVNWKEPDEDFEGTFTIVTNPKPESTNWTLI